MVEATSEAQIYLRCMQELKFRAYLAFDLADKFLNKDCPDIGGFDSACLKLRKTIELIGFSAMTAELDAYKEMKQAFKKDWRFIDIIRNLKKISDNSFPMKVAMQPSEQRGVQWHFTPQNEYAIEPDQLVEWHGRLNQHLHAANPFSSQGDLRNSCLRIKSHVTDILTLLDQHVFLRAIGTGGFIAILNSREQAVTVFSFEEKTDV